MANEKANNYDDTLKKVASGTSIVFVGLLIGMVFNFLFRVFIARNWTDTEFGMFSIGLSILSICGILSTLGLQQGLTVKIAFRRGKNDFTRIRDFISSSIYISLLVSLIAGALVFSLSEFLAVEIFHQPDLINPFRVISVGIPFFTLIQIIIAIFRGFAQVKQIVYFQNIIANGLIIASISLIVLLDKSFIYVFYGLISSYIITFVILVFYSIKQIKSIDFIKMKSLRSLATKELVIFSLPLLGTAMLNLIMSWTDTLMLGSIKTSADAGLYNVSYTLGLLITFALSALIVIHMPIFSGLFAKNKFEEMRKNYLIITKWICSLSLPLFLFLFLFPIDTIKLLFGAEYIFAADALRILSVAFLFSCYVGPCGVTLISMGRSRFVMLTTLVMAIINVSLNAILIPIYSITGAAIATGFSIILINFAKSLKLYFIAGIRPIGKNVIKPSVLYISIMLPLYFYFYSKLEITFLILVLLFFVFNVIFLLVFILSKSLEKEDLNLIKIFEKKEGGFVTKIRHFLSRFV